MPLHYYLPHKRWFMFLENNISCLHPTWIRWNIFLSNTSELKIICQPCQSQRSYLCCCCCCCCCISEILSLCFCISVIISLCCCCCWISEILSLCCCIWYLISTDEEWASVETGDTGHWSPPAPMSPGTGYPGGSWTSYICKYHTETQDFNSYS